MIDLSKILSKHQSGWLALSPDNKKLISTGKTLQEALEKSIDKGVENPSLLKAAPQDKLYVG
jgi:predicted RNase H-like HicB family nuclease